MGKENSREKTQKAHKSNLFCAACAFSRLFHCIPSRRLARLWTLDFRVPEERPDHGPVYPRPGGGPGPSPALCPGYPRMLRPYFQRHRHLLKRLCTLAHESLTEYLRTALGCPAGVPSIIMTLHNLLRQQQDARRPPPGLAARTDSAAAGRFTTTTTAQAPVQEMARPDPPRLAGCPVKVSFGERCGRRIGSLQEPSSKLRRDCERLALLVAHAAQHGIRQAAPAAASVAARKCLLIWVATCASIGSDTMQATIEIGDDLLARTQAVVRKEKAIFRSLTERGLWLVLTEKLTRSSKWSGKAVVVQGGEGLIDEFKRAPWEKIRDAIYQGQGT